MSSNLQDKSGITEQKIIDRNAIATSATPTIKTTAATTATAATTVTTATTATPITIKITKATMATTEKTSKTTKTPTKPMVLKEKDRGEMDNVKKQEVRQKNTLVNPILLPIEGLSNKVRDENIKIKKKPQKATVISQPGKDTDWIKIKERQPVSHIILNIAKKVLKENIRNKKKFFQKLFH